MGKTAEKIGRAIRLRRRALGLSQEELAGKCGLSKTYVARLELARGSREENPTIDTIERLAEALRCDIVDLISGRPAAKSIGKRNAKQGEKLLSEFSREILPEHLELLIDLAGALRELGRREKR